MDKLPRLGKRGLICLLLFTCNYVVSVWRGFLFLWVLGMGYVILLWHSLGLPYKSFFYTFLTLQSIFPLKLMCVRCITIAFFRSTISAAQNGHKFSINGETFFWHFVILYFHLAIDKSKLDLCLFILTHLLWACFKRRETINIMYIIIPLYFLSYMNRNHLNIN